MSIKKILYILLLLSAVMPCHAQQRHWLGGTVTDDDGRPLPGATVAVRETGAGTVTDRDGVYSLQLPEGSYTLICSSMGYIPLEKEITVTGPGKSDFSLEQDYTLIEEVVVSTTSEFDRVRGVQIGSERIEMSEMAKMPAMFGERDIFKSIQLLPGVKAESDGSSGYQVRGGTTAQNMILLDDAPVYNAGHLLGFFSAFNDETLLDATLYKGLIPAQYGNGTSSVFNVNTRSGDYRKYKFGGSVGLLAAKLNAEGPIVPDKLSFSAAARRTHLDAFLGLTKKYKHNTLNFYDLNAKISYDGSDRNKLFASFYHGRDRLGLGNRLGMKWGNMVGTLRWFHRFNDKLYSNTSFIYSDYQTVNGAEMVELYFSFDGWIRQTGIRENFVWSPGEGHTVDIGFESMYKGVLSADWTYNGYREKEKRKAWDNTVWINNEWIVSPSVSLSAGIRFNAFSSLGGSPYYELDADGNVTTTLDYGRWQAVKTHWGVEPRLSLNWQLSPRQSLKAGYSRTSQNLHALRNTSMSMPFDRYTMSSNIIKPQTADQVSVGYAALSPAGMFEFSVETYFKKVHNVLDYKDGKSFNSEIEIERIISAGKGRSYGLELLAKKSKGKLTGWISYTLAWSENKIPGINRNRWYTASNDRRHDLSVVAMYELSDRWRFSATWVFNTGQALTAPSAKYEVEGEMVYYYAERNGYRAPNYHRLDLSATYRIVRPRWTHEVSAGLFNAYNRYNPFIILFEDDDERATGTKATQISLFGIVPSISYNFKF